jgi:hypothetical protein
MTDSSMKVMKKIHVVSECMRRNRIHPLTPFFVPISCLFVFFVVKKGFLCALLALRLVPPCGMPLWLKSRRCRLS